MKTTTIFVAALTVFSTIFLESSATPAPSLIGGMFGMVDVVVDDVLDVIGTKDVKANYCTLDDEKCKMIHERIETSEKSLAEVNMAKEKALAVAGDEHKVGLTKVTEFLNKFNSLVPELHDNIKKLCNGGSEAERAAVIPEMKTAIEDTQTFMANLEDIPAGFQAVFEKNIGIIVYDALDVYEVLDCKENVVSKDQKQEIDARIQANADALEEAKKCLANATGDEKDQLTPADVFLKDLEELFLGLVGKLNKCTNSKSCEGRGELIIELRKASKDTKANLDSLQNIPEVKKCLSQYIEGIMIPNCDIVVEILSKH